MASSLVSIIPFVIKRTGSVRKRVWAGPLTVGLPTGRKPRFKGFDDKIISMYVRGMTTRDIQSHREESYGVEISPTQAMQCTVCASGRHAALVIEGPE